MVTTISLIDIWVKFPRRSIRGVDALIEEFVVTDVSVVDALVVVELVEQALVVLLEDVVKELASFVVVELVTAVELELLDVVGEVLVVDVLVPVLVVVEEVLVTAVEDIAAEIDTDDKEDVVILEDDVGTVVEVRD
ncbi:MAG: hypothetical protein ACYC7D_12610 [Nitrososphaerales archaeon]